MLLDLHICFSILAKASYSFIFSVEGQEAQPSPLSDFVMNLGPGDEGNFLRKMLLLGKSQKVYLYKEDLAIPNLTTALQVQKKGRKCLPLPIGFLL